MTNCEKYDIQLSAYLDGVLDEKERKQVEQHLETCAECRSYLNLLKTVREELREPLPEPPKALAQGILYKIGLEKKQRRRRFLAYGRWTAVAAVVCLAIFGVVRMSGTSLTKSDANSTAEYEYETAAEVNTMLEAAGSNSTFAEEAPAEDADTYGTGAALNAAPDTMKTESRLAKTNTADLPGYEIAMTAIQNGDCYSVCVFYFGLDSGIQTGDWESLSAPEGQQRYLAPAADLQELEAEYACDEIYYGDMAAETGLVVVFTEMER